MSAPRNFELVLNACADDVIAGRRTVDQCLAAHPEHARALRPLLETLVPLHSAVRAAPPATPPDPARRAALMTAIRATPQDAAPRRLARIGAWLAGLRMGPGVSGAALRFATVGASAAIIVLVATALVLTRGGDSAQAATLTLFQGAAERSSGDGWSAIEDGATLGVGSVVRVSADGSALLTFGDGSTIGLGGGAAVGIEAADVASPRRIVVRQDAGELWHYVRSGGAEATYTVHTADAAISATGTVFGTTILDGKTEVSAAEGTVRVQAGLETLNLGAGQRARAAAQQQVSAVTDDGMVLQAQQLAVEVHAPFVASLIAPNGAATGALPGGALFNQITGAVTSNPGEGEQRIAFSRLAPGAYELVLRRIADGDGVLVVNVGGEEQRVLLEQAGDVVRLRIVASADGGATIERAAAAAGSGRSQPPATSTTTPPAEERLVIPEHLRDELVPFLRQREQRGRDNGSGEGRDEERQERPSGASPTTEPTTTPDAGRERERERQEGQQRQERRRDERSEDRNNNERDRQSDGRDADRGERRGDDKATPRSPGDLLPSLFPWLFPEANAQATPGATPAAEGTPPASAPRLPVWR